MTQHNAADHRGRPRRLSRRRLLGLAGAGGVLGVGAAITTSILQSRAAIGPTDPVVGDTEDQRPSTGKTVTATLTPAAATIDLGGRTVQTLAYGNTIPAPLLRATAGDKLAIRLTNQLTQPTSIHWHGIALRNDMDGVPDLTTATASPSGTTDYNFIAAHPGTYWFHPHVGTQPDTGLYGAIILDDPNEPGRYDDEAILILDDWTDGWGDNPENILQRFRSNGMPGMGDMSMGGHEGMATANDPLGTDTGDITYPAHLINGRLPDAPFTLQSRPGSRIRLRIINAASDTPYRFAIGGHTLTITHTDGFPIKPVDADALLIGMGERYDVIITADDGQFPIVAQPEGKPDPPAQALLKTADGTPPPTPATPPELRGTIPSYTDLEPTSSAALPPAPPDREIALSLGMLDGGRRWMINNTMYEDHEPLPINRGERIRMAITNNTMMFHPMHLHGHTFALADTNGRPGIRKDTINVLPMQQVKIDFTADNPGQWLVHCHNIYHAELGMMTTLSYQR